MPDQGWMTGAAFIQRIRKLGRKRSVVVVWESKRGKGDHGTLFYGERRTTIGDLRRELKTGTFHAMLGQLGLTPGDLEDS